MANELKRVYYNGEIWFADLRLKEIRNVKCPSQSIKINYITEDDVLRDSLKAAVRIREFMDMMDTRQWDDIIRNSHG